jgi:hypothetical protein
MGTGQFKGKEYKIDKNAFNVNGLNSYNQEQQARNNQSDFIRQLQAQMSGQGPSLANMQLQQATNRNISQAMGQAASQRGVNPALAARLAMNNVASANQQAAMDSGLIRQQEMINAQQQLGSQIGAQRQGDLAATDRDLGARMGKEQLEVQQATGLNNVNQAGYEGAAKRRGEFISNIGSGFMTGGMYEGGVVPKPTQDPDKVKAFIASFQGKKKPPKKSDDMGEIMDFNEGGIVPEKSKTRAAQESIASESKAETKKAGAPQLTGHAGAGQAVGKGLGKLVSALKGKPQGVGDANINPTAMVTANEGGEVPGRAVTKGDSPKNDFVLALLSPGEIVIPRTASESKEKAKRFVDQLLDKKYKGGKVC